MDTVDTDRSDCSELRYLSLQLILLSYRITRDVAAFNHDSASKML